MYENASTFIHHPLYHPGVFQLSCYKENGFDNPRRWVISTNDNLVADIPIRENTVLDVTIDGVVVPVTFQASTISRSVAGQTMFIATLQVSHVIPGNFVCQSNDFSLALRVVTGMHLKHSWIV